MARSKGFQQFAKRMGFLAEKVGANSEKAVRKAAIAADTTVVMTTPVDTGRARANWFATVGLPANLQLDNTDPSGATAMSQAQAVIAGWKRGQGSIFITNSLPYIVPLEEGSSAQAPNGMTQAAIQAARAELVGYRLLS